MLHKLTIDFCNELNLCELNVKQKNYVLLNET